MSKHLSNTNNFFSGAYTGLWNFAKIPYSWHFNREVVSDNKETCIKLMLTPILLPLFCSTATLACKLAFYTAIVHAFAALVAVMLDVISPNQNQNNSYNYTSPPPAYNPSYR